ncbi:hypothetical protein APT_01678 [Acetobacter pasteurianus NBRC 101655]|uniref:Uncharacterized protein n=1 Tax=Acetobacter pasteurianus TaxID=438 RepID=A0A1A0DL81_ACEPA|nr:hypothetical protein [Acetobacter pasteurianus]OAZ76023.1 hypothetical protein SRCM100623_00291 [Acetobacter pasteurianus]QHM92399.1 hypothetical protein FCN51_13065 [Acetobacter pasteurianus]BAU38760.1 hypothetical protein APT_01678 [Acetobacter pasteurianus NBRC 101655]
MAEEWRTNEPPHDRQAERYAAYAAEFGGIEKKHKDDYRNTQYASIVGQVGCGVAIGLWWHPFVAFLLGLGFWGAVREERKKCDADAARRRLYGIE